jgi:hypothetical protein
MGANHQILGSYSGVHLIDTYINAGGAAASQWIADTGLYDTGSAYNTFSGGWQANSTPLTPGLAAPTDVYQYVRFSASTMTYTLTGLRPSLPCWVRVHSGDPGFGWQQSININGVEVQAAYVLATAAGGGTKIGIKEFVANADVSGNIAIAFIPAGGGSAAVSAIEIAQPVPMKYRMIHTAGDSRTSGGGPIGTSDTWVGQLVPLYSANEFDVSGVSIGSYDDQAKWNFQMAAFSGDTIAMQETRTGLTINPWQSSLNDPEVVFLDCGTNDLIAHQNTAFIEAALTSYFASLNPGFITGIGTILPSTLITGADETTRLAVNSWILANSLGLDFVVDVAGISQLQDPSDTTYYYDGTHCTFAGYTLWANLIKPYFDAL